MRTARGSTLTRACHAIRATLLHQLTRQVTKPTWFSIYARSERSGRPTWFSIFLARSANRSVESVSSRHAYAGDALHRTTVHALPFLINDEQ